MKTKKLLMAVLCLLGLSLVGCNDNKDLNELSGTKWKGVAMATDVSVSFTNNECTIVLSGYVSGTAVGSYSTNQSELTVTINSVSGDSDGQLKKGDVINGSFDLEEKTMTITIVLYGKSYTIILHKV